jgi:hypothetical protein
MQKNWGRLPTFLTKLKAKEVPYGSITFLQNATLQASFGQKPENIFLENKLLV